MSDKNLIDKIQISSSGNVSDSIYNSLRQLIIAGELPPKYTFPNEAVFCEQLHIGRSTLREAYKVLEANGFITRSKRGTYVNDQRELDKSASLLLDFESSDMWTLFEFRAMIESELSALAAQRATEENIANLYHWLEGMKQHISNIERLTYYDTNFHMEIAKASQNKLLINTMYMSGDVFFKGIYKAFHIDTENNINRAIQYHESILFAIEQKDGVMARNAMRSHVQSVQNLML